MKDKFIPREVSNHEANKIIAKYSPIGLFYMYDYKTSSYIGIDNSTGHAWVEEFERKNQCITWLENC